MIGGHTSWKLIPIYCSFKFTHKFLKRARELGNVERHIPIHPVLVATQIKIARPIFPRSLFLILFIEYVFLIFFLLKDRPDVQSVNDFVACLSQT